MPERFRGWSYRRTLGGEHESMQLELDAGGHVYVAVESRAIVEMKGHGWTPEGLDGDSTFTYTDRQRTLMVVFSKEFPTGARCDVPQLAWTGTLVLLPPRDLR